MPNDPRLLVEIWSPLKRSQNEHGILGVSWRHPKEHGILAASLPLGVGRKIRLFASENLLGRLPLQLSSHLETQPHRHQQGTSCMIKLSCFRCHDVLHMSQACISWRWM